MNRRMFLRAASLSLLGAIGAARAEPPTVEVYKSASCDCCRKWVEHVRTAGFPVRVTNVPYTGEYRKKFGVPDRLGACHTARVAGYAIEGHVPVREIERLLKERPDAIGIAVPAMPPGSPGMEGPPPQAYDVLLIHRDGTYTVYGHYDAK